MSGFLLDTSVALTATSNSASLPGRVRKAIMRGPNYLSVVSFWEIVLKSMKGKLMVGEPRSWWEDTLHDLAATPLTLRPKHVDQITRLPPMHQDPFDRVLIAQAITENLIFITTDEEISRYAGERLHVLR